jgi:hypothetical protein
MLIAVSQVGKKIREIGDVSADLNDCTRQNHKIGLILNCLKVYRIFAGKRPQKADCLCSEIGR